MQPHPAPTAVDHDERYLVSTPRGADPVLDALHPDQTRHTTIVYGAAALAERINAAPIGCALSWSRQPGTIPFPSQESHERDRCN
jgi:hypothetical protein